MSASRYQQCPKLPLRKGYTFLQKNGLAKDAKHIRDATIHVAEHSSTHIRRGMIIEVLRQNGLFQCFNDQCWPCSNEERREKRISRYEKDYKAYISSCQRGTPESRGHGG